MLSPDTSKEISASVLFPISLYAKKFFKDIHLTQPVKIAPRKKLQLKDFLKDSVNREREGCAMEGWGVVR